jgi:hypothetical protein
MNTGGGRLVLERGTARERVLTFTQGSPPRHLLVGSSGLCDWRIHAKGVRAQHARFVWTGRCLRVEEQPGSGGITVDGNPIAYRLELSLCARVAMGEALVGWYPVGGVAGSSPERRSCAIPPRLHEETIVAAAGAASFDRSPDVRDATPSSARAFELPARSKRGSMLLAGAVATLLGVILALAFGRNQPATPSSASAVVASAGPAEERGESPAPPEQSVPPEAGIEEAGATPAEALAHLVDGRHAEALGAYRRLAEASGDEPSYGDVVRLLERELGQRCAKTGGGKGCESL